MEKEEKEVNQIIITKQNRKILKKKQTLKTLILNPILKI